VGRRDEIAALEGEFAWTAAGEFRVVLLLGEAGVGKSRLGRELLARHPEAAGMFARAHPLGVTAAFGLWAEAIDPLLQGRPDHQVVAVCGGLGCAGRPQAHLLGPAPRERVSGADACAGLPGQRCRSARHRCGAVRGTPDPRGWLAARKPARLPCRPGSTTFRS
jgi:AAA ATPase domain